MPSEPPPPPPAPSAHANRAKRSYSPVRALQRNLGRRVSAIKDTIAEGLSEVQAALVPDVPEEHVSAPTPEDRWFTPLDGWPAAPADLLAAEEAAPVRLEAPARRKEE